MSGGVDSAVAAALLAREGHEVVGVTLLLADLSAYGLGVSRCCSPIDVEMARAVCSRIGIPHHVLEMSGAFRRAVIEPFVESYLAGETPLPCAHCNARVKFGDLLEASARMGAVALATGHYARIEREGDGFVLRRGRDTDKDQSYFLFTLTPSQLERVRRSKIRLVTAVDKVAASGGYLMASVSDHIIAAPFALVGSIGVVAQVPNVHRLLKKHDVDVEVLTAGKYKRTLTVFGENTEQGRAKFVEELEDVHALFQEFVQANRPQVSIEEIATGEAWYGRRALEHRLIDELSTSDAYLTKACEDADVYEVRWVEHKKPIERLLKQFAEGARSMLSRFGWV